MSTVEMMFIGYGLVFTVMLFLSIKQWRWFHIFVANLLLISTLLLTQITSYVYEFRSAGTKRYEEQVAKRDGLQAEVTNILHGLDDTSARTGEESLISLRNQLERAIEGRGKVWEGLALGDVQGVPTIVGTTATITLPDDTHGIQAGSRMFLFGEREVVAQDVPAAPQNDPNVDPPGAPGAPPAVAPAQQITIKVPAIYFGEYDVETVNGAAVSLKCAFAPRVFNPALMVNGATVAMYETMPADSHFKFAKRENDKYDQLAQSGMDNAAPLFGQMDPQHINGIFETAVVPLIQNQHTIPNANEILAKNQIRLGTLGNKLVEEFVADGGPLNDREVDPKNIWYKIQFNQKTILSQKVNGDDAQAALTEAGVFQSGEAIVPLFYHSTPSTVDFNDGVTTITSGKKTDSITFEDEDIAYIPAAEKIVQENRIVPVEVLVSGAEGVAPVARKILEYFVRPLHDYNHIFHSYEARLQTLAYSDDNARHDIVATTAARNDASVQIEYRKQEKKELEVDLELHRRDEYEAEIYSGALLAEVKNLTVSLAELFERNQTLAQTLAERQAQLEEAINARTQDAENATGNSEE